MLSLLLLLSLLLSVRHRMSCCCCRCWCRSATGCHVAVAVVVVVASVVVAESARTWYGRLLTGVLAAVTERLRGRSAVKTSTVAGVEVGHKACVVVVAESVRT